MSFYYFTYWILYKQLTFSLRRKDSKKRVNWSQRITNYKRLILIYFFVCVSFVHYTYFRQQKCPTHVIENKKKYKQLMNNAYGHSNGQIILFPSGYHFSSLSGTLQSWMLIAPTNVALLFTISIKTCPWSSVTSSYTTWKGRRRIKM